MSSSLSSLSRLLRRHLKIPLLPSEASPSPPSSSSSILHHLQQPSPFPWSSRRRNYSSQKKKSSSSNNTKPETISSLVLPLGHPSISVTPELDRWVHRGKPLRPVELQHLVRELRKRRRCAQALEVSEWMKDKGKVAFTPGDHAVQLDLIGQVRGLPPAESYFDDMDEKDKTEKTYGALLNCYVRERLVERSLSHFQKMKEMGFASNPLPYNNIMSLYTNTDQHEKIPSVLADMKAGRVLPDNFSYRICINSYGRASDMDAVERVVEEMKQQPQIVMDWNTYSVLANIYIREGITDRAIDALKKAEERLDKKDGNCYNHLISLYSVVGDKSEMLRLWELQKENCKKHINRDYGVMLSALMKLGDLEEAERLLKEWESSGNSFDFRVPNVLLSVYRQNGSPEKAEAVLTDYLSKGHRPPSNSWGIAAAGYAAKGDAEKAYELMLNALCVHAPNTGWEPSSVVVKSALNYLGNEGSVQAAETFVGLLQNAIPVERDMYHALIKAHVRAGRKVDKVLERMKEDGIEQNDETLEILSSKSKMAASATSL
ncbi:pentatricopeptide repeat-containing protein isoform X1, mitochondrial [Iris pallida]|uniref:Pentatricopeptide repeat-containing protein isoform X1, mitochondrial n=1 Tax=Iris pallida TaxID=29817 RepID=A0AAX6F5J4_IRIPA|nr:pentatricopeptide repeat-containing protein isoform X1, mitochondrial [Iris pallida]